MNEPEKMVFVNPNEIPAKTTRKGAEWLALFNEIPLGKVWKISIKDGKYKAPTLKQAVSKINKNIKDVKTHFDVIQRTVSGETFVYVIHGVGE